jgi:enoyl-CoA hydratase/carnithine racemase
MFMPVLLSEQRGQTVVLTLNRPEVLNALSNELTHALLAAVHDASHRRDVRSIVIAGAGERAFSAGTDLKERRHMDADQKWAQAQALWEVNQALWDSPKAVIAAIGGWCLGGGFVLSLYCDLRIAADDVSFGWPEMTLGAYPGSGTLALLPRIVGRSKAKEMLFTTRRFGADEALAMGLVERVVPRAGLLDAALDWAREMERTSPLGLAAVKRSINQGCDRTMAEAAEIDQALRRPLEATRDYEEGIRAHFEKRTPVFVGE